MRELRFKQVDVFTRVPYQGNPVAVVFGADGLSVERMGAISRWTNLSEATFVQRPLSGDYRLRIFNKQLERPFAGHPTIGSAFAVREEGLVDRRARRLIQECFAGLIPIDVGADDILIARAPAAKVRREVIPAGRLAGLTAGVSFTEAQVIDVGPVWVVARVLSGDINRIRVNFDELADISRDLDCSGLTAYQIDSDGRVEVRSFAPAMGVPEDPVCGSGNAAVAHHVRLTGIRKRIGSNWIAHQGRALGRDGRVYVQLQDQEVYIGGHAVTCVDGVIRLPEDEPAADRKEVSV